MGGLMVKGDDYLPVAEDYESMNVEALEARLTHLGEEREDAEELRDMRQDSTFLACTGEDLPKKYKTWKKPLR
jgi:hypothetical protein